MLLMMLLLMEAEQTDMAVIMIERQVFTIAIKKRELNSSLYCSMYLLYSLSHCSLVIMGHNDKNAFRMASPVDDPISN